MARRTEIAAVSIGATAALLITSMSLAPGAGAASADVDIQRSGPDSATVTFDLAGLPANAVLVVERRLGPKSPYVEVERTTEVDGVVSIDLPDTSRAMLRATVLGSRGSVLMRTAATL
jgi:hypothetical protein